VDAPIELRYQRSLERKREGEGGNTFLEFEAEDKKEIRGRSDRLIVDERGHHGEMIDYGVNLGACKRKANKVIINDGALPELEKKTVDVVEHKMKSLKEGVD
jgi:hypothetical protein